LIRHVDDAPPKKKLKTVASKPTPAPLKNGNGTHEENGEVEGEEEEGDEEEGDEEGDEEEEEEEAEDELPTKAVKISAVAPADEAGAVKEVAAGGDDEE